MGIARVTRNFQVTIPKDVREVQGIKEGDKVIFSVDGSKVEVSKFKNNFVEEAFGAWKAKVEPGANYVKKIRSEWKIRNDKLSI
ncbi:MAG TPA: AbrB/MazE/SpoVT family DNA-binding domain-containing protein [archaeon]|nr:AbrB/MazE/SpoVT family DNA-binding domain-containing protein [archaeon]